MSSSRWYLWVILNFITDIQMETGPTSQSITIKLACMMVLIIIDLVLNSFIESSFSLSFQSSYQTNYYFIVDSP
jgi:hypothetical protein